MHTVRLIAAAATVLLALWLSWYITTRPARPDREERARARSRRAHARDLASGPPQLAELSPMRELEETTVAISRADLRSLFVAQDREVGEEYVRDLEARLAASFGLIELEGVSR